MKRVNRCIISWLFITLMMNPALLLANDILAKEYFIKAAFLYNFARLTEWPPNSFKSAIEPIRLCFMGEEPFDKALHTIRNKKVRGRPLIFLYNVALYEASRCKILFISQSEHNNIEPILGALNQYPILTVSELPGFTQKGGHIRFFLTSSNTISLEVNLEAIKQANLQISSRILTLAKIVSSAEAAKP